MRYLIDRTGRLSNKRRTPTGGYLVDATTARVGVLPYPEKGERHFNPVSVLESSLESFTAIPVTNRHPKKMVDTTNYREVSCGSPVGTPVVKGGMIHATLAVQDVGLIDAIERGEVEEVSMGYLADVVPEAGEYEGEAYDHVRKNITWNHIAIVPKGRAGAAVCLCLDSAEIPEGEKKMFTINGKQYDAESAQAAIDAMALVAQESASKATELELRVAELETKLTAATSAEAMDAAVQAELSRREAVAAGLARREAVQKRYPRVDLSGKSQEVIDAMHEIMGETDVQDMAPGAAGGEPSANRDEAPTTWVDPRQKMLEENRKLYKRASEAE